MGPAGEPHRAARPHSGTVEACPGDPGQHSLIPGALGSGSLHPDQHAAFRAARPEWGEHEVGAGGSPFTPWSSPWPSHQRPEHLAWGQGGASDHWLCFPGVTGCRPAGTPWWPLPRVRRRWTHEANLVPLQDALGRPPRPSGLSRLGSLPRPPALCLAVTVHFALCLWEAQSSSRSGLEALRLQKFIAKDSTETPSTRG